MARKGEPGSKRRDKDNYRRISPQNLKLVIDAKLDSIDEKAFVATLWLTGARVSEIIGELKKEHIYDEIIEGKTFVVFDEIPILKLKKKSFRTLSMPLDESHRPFLEILSDYVQSKEQSDILFEFSRSTAWRIVNKCTNLWPHFIRHSRLTNLAKEYGFDSFDIMMWAGWASSQMADNYVKLDWRRTAKKFL